MHPVAERPLSRAVVEIERHMSASGWDQPAQLFALVPTAELLAAEPGLAAQLVADAGTDLTPVAQEGLPAGADDEGLAGALARIEWPDAVTGCAVAVERVVLPAEAEESADAYSAARDPRRHEVRMVAGVLRDGERFGAVRLRSHDEDDAVLTGTDLVPTLCEVLALTFAPGDGEDGPMAGADAPDGTADGEESQR
jgi:hypothetical protein